MPDRERAVALLGRDLVGLVFRGGGVGRDSSLGTWSRAAECSVSIEVSTKDGFGRGDGRRSMGGCIFWLRGEFVGELANDELLVVAGSFGGDNERARSVAQVNNSGPIFNRAV